MYDGFRRFVFQAGIFLSAFLLFAIQPMIAKFFLPWFGGSASVWAISLTFFTAVLLFGYIYAHVLSHRRPHEQFFIHGVLLFLGVALLLMYWFQQGLPFLALASLEISETVSHAPTRNLLWLLVLVVGLPYFVLSSTSPLLQVWVRAIDQRTPYRLYSLSNVGSLSALIAYPFFIEPLLDLKIQSLLWAAGFVICAVFLFTCAIFFFRKHRFIHPAPIVPIANVKRNVLMRWVALSFLPASLLVSTTNFLTQSVASVSFFWVIPLALYILTFILAFANISISRMRLIYCTMILAVLSLIVMGNSGFNVLLVELAVFLGFFFASALLFHTLLYEQRPDPEHLTLYYILISVGGALGTMTVSIGAPLLFDRLIEFPFSLFLVFSVSIFLLVQKEQLPLFFKNSSRLLQITIVIFLCALIIPFFTTEDRLVILRERNFYGALRVEADEVFGGKIRVLKNGSIVHGTQFLDSQKEFHPTTYYTHQSGMGQVLSFQETGALRVAVIGLGAGTVAAYCEKLDVYRFFEIDPTVEQIAREQFSYLKTCPGATVILGDARLSLAKEEREQSEEPYDVIIVDAFTDGSIPVHLLTREAMDVYLSRLKTDGVIAVHISNRYLELTPVLRDAATVNALEGVLVKTQDDEPSGGYMSLWVLLSHTAREYQKISEGQEITDLFAVSNRVRWTDTYSNLLSVIR